MKSLKIVVPMLLLMGLATAANAAMSTGGSAMKGKFTLSGMGGLEVPTADLSDKDKGDQGLGWNGGGAVDYFVTDQISVGADVSYFATKNKDDITDTSGNVIPGAEAKAKTLFFGAHGKWFLPTGGGSIMPWLGAGVGMYNRKVELSQSGASIEFKDNKFGGNAGVGVDYRMTDMVSLGVNGMYHLTGKFEDTQDIGGTQASLSSDNWSFMSFSGALTIHFPTGMGSAAK